jgi:hypothetical protein
LSAARCGASTVLTSGAWSWARCWPRTSSRACTAAMPPGWMAPPQGCWPHARLTGGAGSVITLTLEQARLLHLACAGPAAVPPAALPRRWRCACITAHAALLQIDTIHVVARSPYLVLFHAWAHYPRRWLDEALAQGHLFETWAHEACFAPMRTCAAPQLQPRTAPALGPDAQGAQRSTRGLRAHLDRLLAHIGSNGAGQVVRLQRARRPQWWLVGLEGRKALARSPCLPGRIDGGTARQLPACV